MASSQPAPLRALSGQPTDQRPPLPGPGYGRAIAWDFNYRGDLRFLEQAQRQLPPSHVHDGWRYFIHGWTQVIAEVFAIEMTSERMTALENAAERTRHPRPGG